MSILIVEDNVKLAQNISEYLHTEHINSDIAYDGETGLHMALKNSYEALVLDLNLPKIDGLAVCAQLRSKEISTPILILTARTGPHNVVSGLTIGADDYVSKPFDLSELLARLQALIRRTTLNPPKTLRHGNLVIDCNSHSVSVEGNIVQLAPKEYSLLTYLMNHQGIAQDRTTLLAEIWGEDPDMLFSQTIDVHIAYIRRKIGKEHIQTISGVGYVLPIIPHA